MQNKFSFSTAYRAQAIRSIFAILLFIIVYLVVLLLSFALVTFLFYSAFWVLRSAPGPKSILIFLFIFFIIDVVAITLLIFIFMFFFRKQTVDRSGWIEISWETQPKLFKLIESISKELDTNFPNKVYLGAGVDAMVFYDSNFRNLFIPSKENLMIGLGLVNSMNESELKAILVHEFGHFTQRSLNVYSYVYIENQVIFKMLIDEEFYQTLLLKFSIVGKISWIVIFYSRIIRWILGKAYEIVSKSYMALSREMEFHADEISALTVGSAPAISALLRTGLASDAFHYVWQFYYNRITENIKSENLYPQHTYVMNKFAEKYGLHIENDLPKVTIGILARFNRSKLIIENQWASHPSIADRIKRIEILNINSEISFESAWNFFINSESVQKEMTDRLFRNWQYAESPVDISCEQFKELYQEDAEKHTFNKRYNRFYEFRDISLFDVKKAIQQSDEADFLNFDEIYSDHNIDFIRQFSGLDMDLKMVESISKKEININSFEYDGVKYQSEESKLLLDKLVQHHKTMYNEVTNLDIKIFRYFLKNARLLKKDEELIKYYETYFYLLNEDKSNLQVYLDLINSMQFIYRVHSFKQIEKKLEEMKFNESVFRKKLTKILNDENYQTLLTSDQSAKFEDYLSSKWSYFNGKEYVEEELKMFGEVIYQFYELCSRAPFFAMKKMLDFQTEILEDENPAPKSV